MATVANRRVVGVLLIVIAVAGLGLAAYQLRTWAWDSVEGKVESCQHHSVVRKKTRSDTQNCIVHWTAEGVPHQATIDFPGTLDRTGTTQRLRVSGQSAERDGDRTGTLAYAAIAILLLFAGAHHVRKVGGTVSAL
ncbi:hypothetical protein [Hamadaea tsunoensis]|uniref:hypothetical protein n=1 Tax=Hamadaea tsunoensis TaxID=53368 RepID=UPI000429EBE6|nr:hypothetical protein [Hamadaea tsunoensis]